MLLAPGPVLSPAAGITTNKNDGMNQSVTGPLGCHPSAARRLALCVVGVAVCLAVSLAIRSGVAQGATAPVPSTTTTSSPAPGLAFASTSPVLVETSTNHWSTRVVVTISSACPPGGTLWFWVVLPSNETVHSTVTQRKVSCLSGELAGPHRERRLRGSVSDTTARRHPGGEHLGSDQPLIRRRGCRHRKPHHAGGAPRQGGALLGRSWAPVSTRC